MEQKFPQSKWEAKVSTKLAKASADQIWPLCKDFFNLHKWFPGLSVCHGIHGSNGEPGCIRYCARLNLPTEGGEQVVSWAKERLLAIDHDEKSITYEIFECNIGFESYVSTLKVVPRGGDGCVMEWSFAVDPVEGWKFEDLVKGYEEWLQGIANKMEEDVVGKIKAEKEPSVVG
ncbi:hypothetical protein RJ639_029084 [Escallonia herrerae]|uniref:Lachrymatory factor synthase n=1 Tax=Escallonia herrerae TaxID=1293975 RepID=A0AA88X7I5_9ASTE|nr:hypothetical protein RJ639_029084 [Escallonia herrerae]